MFVLMLVLVRVIVLVPVIVPVLVHALCLCAFKCDIAMCACFVPVCIQM